MQRLQIGKIDEEEKKSNEENASHDFFDSPFGECLKCCLCFQVLERPVTAPCGHNFCLICFKKWIGNKKTTCAKCFCPNPYEIASNPRINWDLVSIIRVGKVWKNDGHAFRIKSPEKTRKTYADFSRILVTIPTDHFGPIPAENDPVRNQGVLVGELWEDRVECRQWGVHFAHYADVAGQSDYGAQSVAISGGYEDVEDHGEWFLFTGSGGRNLNCFSEDQKFENLNEALRVSCKFGYPVRVVRSYKDKCSAYAPKEGVRYDGIYRIEKCWRKVKTWGLYKVCRYLFVRCDNERAPWTSDEHGDRPRPLPDIPELYRATDPFEREESPSWDFDEGEGRWRWMKPPPASQKSANVLEHEKRNSMMIALACLLLFVYVIFIGTTYILYRVFRRIPGK